MILSREEVAFLLKGLTENNFYGILEIKIFNGRIVRCEKKTTEIVISPSRRSDEETGSGEK